MTAYATAKQLNLIARLASERGLDKPATGGLTIQDASALIDQLFTTPRPARPASERVVEAGMYRTADGTIYRVQPARGSGNLYAKQLLAGGGFEYVAGAIRRLTPADRMTLAQAQAFGVETGVCCVCGAMLTDPDSVARGIGPVCATRF